MSSALIVIDVQNVLFEPEPRPYEADAVIDRINGLIARARTAKVPVLFVQHESSGTPIEYGSPGWAQAAGLDARPDDPVVRKTTPDSFLRTDLAERLAVLGATRLVLCGYATEVCVDTTTRRAAGLGYQLTLAADAHTTHDKTHASAAQIRTHHNATLSAIRSFGVPIQALPAAEIMFDA
ncbi:cysteine hydrolase family protein [Crenobacter sp. SG2305]|uniref:cysteine hydrolase family protein n=1 Tax=Crenobacter oryzisoli TaxID=3056844 RepID=UPI0025AB36ED|nr:cysteine hydrolase family protein [Crenobacter sp. SG2305]MDN0085080.1 cysteine hydrolase family protein [Crenobacter sp. SG2305]